MSEEFKSLWVSLSADEKRQLAAAAHSSVATLSQVAHGSRGAGASIIRRLLKADSRVKLEWFFPEAA